MVPRVYSDKNKQQSKEQRRERQKSYLPRKVRETEEKKAFVYEHRAEYYEGDFDKILSEAEKSRLIYIILDKVKTSQTPTFIKAMKGAKDVTQLEGVNEALQYYLKRNQLLKEMVPLWSKSRLIRAGHEGAKDPKDSKLIKQVKCPVHMFVNVDKVREYYGDEIAIYFEWMNYF